jgi:hypothetical protein
MIRATTTTISDATMQMLQQPGIIALNQRIQGVAGTDFAGGWIEHAHHGTLVIETTNPARTRARAAAVLRQYARYHLPYRFQAASRSFASLQADATLIERHLRPAGVLFDFAGVDIEHNDVHVVLYSDRNVIAAHADPSTNLARTLAVTNAFSDVRITRDGGPVTDVAKTGVASRRGA